MDISKLEKLAGLSCYTKKRIYLHFEQKDGCFDSNFIKILKPEHYHHQLMKRFNFA